MKIFGAIMVITGTTCWGFWFSGRLQKRLRSVREFLYFLESLWTEISYGLKPLPEAITIAACDMKGPARRMMHNIAIGLRQGDGISVSEAWRREFLLAAENLAVGREESEALLSLGGSLGGSGREDQLRLIQAARERLKIRENLLEGETARKVKLWRYLGFMAGAALVAVFY
ncbi:MAG: hypothetical protein ACM3WV_11785 [Bacillota bacterium]